MGGSMGGSMRDSIGGTGGCVSEKTGKGVLEARGQGRVWWTQEGAVVLTSVVSTLVILVVLRWSSFGTRQPPKGGGRDENENGDENENEDGKN